MMNRILKTSTALILGGLVFACAKEEINEEVNTSNESTTTHLTEATLENAGELHNEGLDYIFNSYLDQKDELEEEITFTQVISFFDNSMDEYLTVNGWGAEIEAMNTIAYDLLSPCYEYEFGHCETSIYEGYSTEKIAILIDMTDLVRAEGTIAETVDGLEDLKTQVDEELTEEEKPAMIGGLNVAIGSYTYWSNNRLDWKDEIPGSPADAELSPYVAGMDALGFVKGYEYYGNVWGGIYGAVLLSSQAAEIERLRNEIEDIL